jgi:hypothetical protein
MSQDFFQRGEKKTEKVKWQTSASLLHAFGRVGTLRLAYKFDDFSN